MEEATRQLAEVAALALFAMFWLGLFWLIARKQGLTVGEWLRKRRQSDPSATRWAKATPYLVLLVVVVCFFVLQRLAPIVQ